jgi:glutamyl-tRNA synthetase
MPDRGITTIQDMVQGEVSVQNSSLDDLVLLRSDRTPTYMLAVVVDDHDMGITHVIRGDDHLNNAFRQYHIYQGAGWPAPIFGHIPLIHGSDGTKMSKRHGALGVNAYRDMGFLPEAVGNYLSRLGWSHGDDELFSREEAATWFDGRHIGKAPARFDIDKLKAVNQYWLRKMPADALAHKLIEMHGGVAAAKSRGWLEELMPLFTERAQTLIELHEMTKWLFSEGAPTINEDAAALLTDEAKNILQKIAKFLSTSKVEKDQLDAAFKDWIAAEGLKMRDVGLPLRVALTGTKAAPSILDIVRGLGTEETLNRINQICT